MCKNPGVFLSRYLDTKTQLLPVKGTLARYFRLSRRSVAFGLVQLWRQGKDWGMAKKSPTALELAEITAELKEAEEALVSASNRYLQVWKSFPGARAIFPPLGYMNPLSIRPLESRGILITVSGSSSGYES